MIRILRFYGISFFTNTKISNRTIELSSSNLSNPLPKAIKFNSKTNRLTIAWQNGLEFTYLPEYLRVYSPSALGVSSDNGFAHHKRGVSIIQLEKVGNYAIRICFDDLHDTGIFSWDLLYQLGEKKWSFMKNYVLYLKQHGKSRWKLVASKRKM